MPPLVSTPLCTALPARDRTALLQSFVSFGADIGDQKPWTEIVSGLTAWFRACGATARRAGGRRERGTDSELSGQAASSSLCHAHHQVGRQARTDLHASGIRGKDRVCGPQQ